MIVSLAPLVPVTVNDVVPFPVYVEVADWVTVYAPPRPGSRVVLTVADRPVALAALVVERLNDDDSVIDPPIGYEHDTVPESP